jgi:hypothetical protein
MDVGIVVLAVGGAVVVLFLFWVFRSFHSIGPAEVGLVTKRIGRNMEGEQLVALNGEAGYQAAF